MFTTEKEKIIILASQSPRRAEILKKATYHFLPFPVYVSEIPRENLSLDEQIIDIAQRKAQACLDQWPDRGLDAVILASDTMVCMDEKAYGKPEDEQMAFDFLKLFSGRTHQVKTAVILIDLLSQEILSHIETSQVHFKTLTDSEIWDYIKTNEPMDKAGAYGIQGLGGKFVEKFEGDFNNIVGLPLHAIEKIFMMKKWQFKKI